MPEAMSLNENIFLLSKRIKEAFSNTEMPPREKLVEHMDGCHECAEALYLLEQYRNTDIPDQSFRRLRMYLHMLTPEAFRWILGNYLVYCLSEKGRYNQDEAEFLVYCLRPSEEFSEKTQKKISLLNQHQLNCLCDFLLLCTQIDSYMFFVKDTEAAFAYMNSLKSNK